MTHVSWYPHIFVVTVWILTSIIDLDGLSLNSGYGKAITAVSVVCATVESLMQNVEKEEKCCRKVARKHKYIQKGKAENIVRDLAGTHKLVVN